MFAKSAMRSVDIHDTEFTLRQIASVNAFAAWFFLFFLNSSFFTTHGSGNGSRTEKNMLEQMILVTTFFAYPFPLDFFSIPWPCSLWPSMSAFCSARAAAPTLLPPVQCGSFNLHGRLFAARSQRLFADVARKRVFPLYDLLSND